MSSVPVTTAQVGPSPDVVVRCGRPSDLVRHTAILTAALQVIAEVGYERASMDAIAARCRASKATMYRHWPCKADLVADALKHRANWEPLQVDTGQFRSDLVQGLTAMVSSSNQADLELYVGLMSTARTDPALAAVLREVMVAPKLALIRTWVDRAIARGELPPTASAELVCEVGPAVLFGQLCFNDQPLPDYYVEHVVDDIVLPLLLR